MELDTIYCLKVKQMDKQKYDKINEVLYSHKLSNGLKVLLFQKLHFCLATFVTHFGSINNRLSYGERKNILKFH